MTDKGIDNLRFGIIEQAAKMNGLDYKDYMRVRRRDGMNHD